MSHYLFLSLTWNCKKILISCSFDIGKFKWFLHAKDAPYLCHIKIQADVCSRIMILILHWYIRPQLCTGLHKMLTAQTGRLTQCVWLIRGDVRGTCSRWSEQKETNMVHFTSQMTENPSNLCVCACMCVSEWFKQITVSFLFTPQ